MIVGWGNGLVHGRGVLLSHVSLIISKLAQGYSHEDGHRVSKRSKQATASCTSPSQVSAYIMLINMPLAKASHGMALSYMARGSCYREGV